jgi:hypothetical protein
VVAKAMCVCCVCVDSFLQLLVLAATEMPNSAHAVRLVLDPSKPVDCSPVTLLPAAMGACTGGLIPRQCVYMY